MSEQRFETGISVNNLKNWGELEAVKEFLQNAVYAKTILSDEVSIEHDGTMAIIHNTPSGFTKGKLLIGESEQSDVAGAPGQYGEGMKAAMAVARRAGLECLVQTNGFTVRPELEPSQLDESVNSLVFYIEDNDNNGGTTFMIQCSEQVFEQAKSAFAVLSGVDEELVKENSVLSDEGGSIYVNGVLVYKYPSVFNYNFTSAELMNRDRSTVDINKVRGYVSGVMKHMTSGMIKAILDAGMKDDTILEAQCSPQNEQAWKVAVAHAYGSKVAIHSTTESDTQAKYRGFKVISPPNIWESYFVYNLNIPYSSDIAKQAKAASKTHRKPSADESQNLGWAKRLIKLYYADYGTVKVAEDLHDEYGNKAYGLYDRKTGVTWLEKGILTDKQETFKTLLHETVHRETGASDNTEEFTRGWEHASWMILTRGKGE
jgi:hypothetical protein